MSIQIQNLSYYYAKDSAFEKKALDNINVEINKGEFVGLIGHTGSGKSTLVQHLNVLLKPHEGKILIDGSECEIVKAGKTATFEIPDGSHDIQVIFGAVPPVNSNVLRIEQSDGDMAFEVKIKVPLKNSDPTYAELTKS